jgi:hypothetical protein
MDTRRVSALALLVAISFVLLFDRPGHATDAIDWRGFRLEVVETAGPRPGDPAALRVRTDEPTRGLRARYVWRVPGGEWTPLAGEPLVLTSGGRLDVLGEPHPTEAAPAVGSDGDEVPARWTASRADAGTLTVPAAALDGRTLLLCWKRVEPHGLSIEVATRSTDEPGAVRAGTNVSTATRGTGPLVRWPEPATADPDAGPGIDDERAPRTEVDAERFALIQSVVLADGRELELGLELTSADAGPRD